MGLKKIGFYKDRAVGKKGTPRGQSVTAKLPNAASSIFTNTRNGKDGPGRAEDTACQG